MLEHFGIKDIWVAIKKNRYLVIVWIAVFSCLFGFITYKNLQSMKVSSEGKEPLSVTSASYYVEPNMNNNINLEKLDSSLFNYLPNNFVAMLKTEAYVGYLCDKLLELYTSDYIIEKSNIEAPKNDIKFLPQAVKSLYGVKRAKESMVLDLYSLSSDKELSKTVLDLSKEYLEKHVEKQNGLVKLDFLGETVKNINSIDEILSSEEKASMVTSPKTNQSLSKKSIIKSIVKNMVVPVGGLTLALVFFLSLKAFFYPTLNRKSDFCEYDVPVIGEIEI